MPKERILAIKDEPGLCWKCLKKFEKINIIKFEELGYGSGFDGFATEIHLCEKCLNATNGILNVEIIEEDDEQGHIGYEHYDHEDEIFKYFESLPLVSKQFVYNEFDTGFDARPMEAQDWIDYQQEMLPYEKAKEYGLYAHEEVAAYRERFPKCAHPVNKLYHDGSKGCWCPFGAHGEYGQKDSEYNISDECYQCTHFKCRTEPIKDIHDKDWDEYKLFVQYNENKEELEKKFR